MLLESPQNWSDYELIDSGNFEKLERFGQYILARPEPKALWDKTLSAGEWDRLAHTRFVTGAGFGRSGKEDSGTWKMLKKMPEQWYIRYNAGGLDFKLRLGLTSFKHVGVFPEQAPNWNFIYSQSRQLVNKFKSEKREELPKVLNLFAYTGAASLAAKAAGADTTHLDSVRQVVTWAKGNMESSGLDNIRWVVEDALKFVKRSFLPIATIWSLKSFKAFSLLLLRAKTAVMVSPSVFSTPKFSEVSTKPSISSLILTTPLGVLVKSVMIFSLVRVSIQASWPTEQVGMSQLTCCYGIFQCGGQSTLSHYRIKGRRAVFPCRNNIVFHILGCISLCDLQMYIISCFFSSPDE